MNNSKEQTGKEGKSALDLLRSEIPFSTWQYNSRTEDRVVQVIEKYSKSLQQRISQLIAELKRKDEALDNTINFCQQWCQSPEEIAMLKKAKQALKPKSDGTKG